MPRKPSKANVFKLAPGELHGEVQFTEVAQGARGASLVTDNRRAQKSPDYRSGFHSLTCLPACLLTLPITNVFCFYVFWNKNQIRMKKKQLIMLTTRVVNGAQRCVRRCVRRRRGRCGGERRAHRDGRAVVSSLRSRPSEARCGDACDKGAADERPAQQEATRGGERLAQQAE